MGHTIEGTREVKIYRVGLALGADSGGYDVKERNKISNSSIKSNNNNNRLINIVTVVILVIVALQ
jgi:hypothetical protein